MDLTLIGQDAAAAKVAYRQYRQLRMRSSEDDQIMRAYRQAAKGTPLIKLSEAIALGGFDAKHLPRLAVCRADFKWCECESGDGRLIFREWYGRTSYAIPPRGKPKIIRFNVPGASSKAPTSRATVPVIPPHLRPSAGLHNYTILWEAEWSLTAPKDPALLKHVGGDLYAVLAVWDLTEIERAVLAGRRPE